MLHMIEQRTQTEEIERSMDTTLRSEQGSLLAVFMYVAAAEVDVFMKAYGKMHDSAGCVED